MFLTAILEHAIELDSQLCPSITKEDGAEILPESSESSESKQAGPKRLDNEKITIKGNASFEMINEKGKEPIIEVHYHRMRSKQAKQVCAIYSCYYDNPKSGDHKIIVSVEERANGGIIIRFNAAIFISRVLPVISSLIQRPSKQLELLSKHIKVNKPKRQNWGAGMGGTHC